MLLSPLSQQTIESLMKYDQTSVCSLQNQVLRFRAVSHHALSINHIWNL